LGASVRKLIEEFHLYAESGALVLCADGLAERDGKEVFEHFCNGVDIPAEVLEGVYFPIGLSSGKPFNARVIVGDLTPDEDSQSVLQVTWRLSIPNGRLVIADGFGVLECGGNIDQIGEGVKTVAVPPGDYCVTVEGYLPSAIHDGDTCALRECWRKLRPDAREVDWKAASADEELSKQLARRETLGAWFRRTCPGKTPPDWLLQFSQDNPRQFDPGYETYWERETAGRNLEEAWLDYLSYTIQLVPLASPPSLPSWWESRCFQWERRYPSSFPLGIRVHCPRP
jgi:hypothetical protein